MSANKFDAALSEIEMWIWIVVGLGLLLFVGLAGSAAYYLFLYVAKRMNHET